MKDNPYHPKYGLPHAMRVAAVKDAKQAPVRLVAERYNVGVSTLYKWKRALRAGASAGQDRGAA